MTETVLAAEPVVVSALFAVLVVQPVPLAHFATAPELVPVPVTMPVTVFADVLVPVIRHTSRWLLTYMECMQRLQACAYTHSR